MDDRYAINAAKTEIREGYNSGDVERILAVYLDGFGDMSDGFPSLGRAESKAALRERLNQLFFRYQVEFVPVIMFIDLLGEAALDCGWHELTLHPKSGGETVVFRTRYMELWRKGSDGAWGIALFIDNADLAPMMIEDLIQTLRSDQYDPAALPDYRVPNSTQSL